MSNEIGLREARASLGPLANRAHLAGEITYLTRNGERIAAIVPLDRITQEPKMRNVISTNTHVDVTNEYAEQVDKILDDAFVDRTTYQKGDEQKTFYVNLVSYDAPDGNGPRWAVDYYDTASREVEEFDNEYAANARYEEMVNAAASNLSINNDGEQETFDETDVPGVPGYEA